MVNLYSIYKGLRQSGRTCNVFNGFMRVIIFLTAFFCLRTGTGLVCADTNLVLNGGFEAGDVNVPDAWTPKCKGHECIRDKENFHQGKHSIKIMNTVPQTVSWYSSLIPCEEGTVIQIQAWMKISDVIEGKKPWHQAAIMVLALDSKGRQLSYYDLAREKGTVGWASYQGKYILPAGTKQIQVKCFLDNCMGTAWFDDIEIVDLGGFVGHKIGRSPGLKELDIQYDAKNVIGPVDLSNGIFYHTDYGIFKEIEGAKPDIIRLAPLTTNYGLYEKKNGWVSYHWSRLDRDIERILALHAVPFLNICWVPDEMKQKVEQRDYTEWSAFVYAMVKHYSEKYDVSDWYWSFWNEPEYARGSLMKATVWDGNEFEFFDFYRLTIDAALRANPKIKVGGCGFGNDLWVKAFVERCGQNKTRLDFLCWHWYGILPYDFLADIQLKRKMLAQYPHLKDSELIIDEWGSFPPHYKPEEYYLSRSNYAAAYRVASIYYMLEAGLAKDIWFNAQEAPFGIIVNGVKQATYGTFVMINMLGKERISVSPFTDDPYIGTMATREPDGRIAVLIWYFKYYADLKRTGEKVINLHVAGMDYKRVKYACYLIDEHHSNGFNDRKKQDLEKIDEGSRDVAGESLSYTMHLMPNSVALLVLSDDGDGIR